MRSVMAALLVALWLGAALLTVAVVTPGAFAVLPTRAMAGDSALWPALATGTQVVSGHARCSASAATGGQTGSARP